MKASAVPNFTSAKMQVLKVLKGRQNQRDVAKGLINGKADCFTLRKRITKLKVSIQKSGQSTFTLNRVPSVGSMAPCRSHHGNHTRQEMDH